MRLVYRFCQHCRSTHVGPKGSVTTCPYVSVHSVRPTKVPTF